MNIIALVFKYKKAIAGIGAILTVLVLWNQIHDHIYNKGVSDERVRLQAEFNRQYEAQRKEFDKQLQNQLQTISDDYQAQLEIERARVRIEYRTKEVIEYVDREIEVPIGCDALVNDVIRVLQQATGIVSYSSAQFTGSTN